jgi:hypothetical protein
LEIYNFAASVSAKLEAGEEISLDDIEEGFRDAALRDGSLLFSNFLSAMEETAPVCDKCGAKMKNLGKRGKNVVSLLGDGEISRNYYECPVCGFHSIPKDKMLSVEGTSFTPGVRRVVAKLAACDSFENSSAALEEFCGIYVSGKDIERIAHTVGAAIESEDAVRIESAFSLNEPSQPAESVPIMYIEYDGTGVPVTKREAIGRKGKQEDGTAKTREAKLGCIFTQTSTGDKNKPIRDKNSTTYFGAIETSDLFGRRLYMEAARRGAASAEKVVVIGDGAKWIWNLADCHFPKAIQIIDLYHAKEHLSAFVKNVVSDTETQQETKNEWFTLLEDGDIKTLASEMTQSIAGMGEEQKEKATTEINYFTENANRMQYADFKKQGLFVGSGVIEAGCKNVIGKRLKQSGMHWSVKGANAVIALRCSILSGRFNLLRHNHYIA